MRVEQLVSPPRFRWTTVQRALDVLVDAYNNAQMVALIEEVGSGPEFDGLQSFEKTTPKLRNLLSRACRQEPPRCDADGTPLSDRMVREAARCVPPASGNLGWTDVEIPPRATHAALLNSLAVDGWRVEERMLIPTTSHSLENTRSSLRLAIEARGGAEAATRLDQLERGLDEGHWESANGDARAFLNAIFSIVARDRLDSEDAGLQEGAARKALQTAGFFRTDPRNSQHSFEANFVKALAEMLGSEGAHTGLSDQQTAIFRYAVTILTAEYFLKR